MLISIRSRILIINNKICTVNWGNFGPNFRSRSNFGLGVNLGNFGPKHCSSFTKLWSMLTWWRLVELFRISCKTHTGDAIYILGPKLCPLFKRCSKFNLFSLLNHSCPYRLKLAKNDCVRIVLLLVITKNNIDIL